MEKLTNQEIICIIQANCVGCEKDTCPLQHLAQHSTPDSLSKRLNIERKNKVKGIVNILGECLIINPKANGDLTL